MKIKFYAHSSFRLEGDGLAVVTDPYQPGPQLSGFDPIDEPADLVLMSSTTDPFHADPSHVRGDPLVVNALDIPPQGGTYRGLAVRAFRGRERIHWPALVRGFLPRRNAIYAFTLDGIRVLHTGDLGRPLPRRVLRQLAGRIDLMFALAGAVHNIEHDDLLRAIDAIAPRVVIPMHYYSPRGRLKILAVDELARRFPADRVVRVDGPEVELTLATLPAALHLYVLEQSR